MAWWRTNSGSRPFLIWWKTGTYREACNRNERGRVTEVPCNVVKVFFGFQVTLDSVYRTAVALEEASQLDLGTIAVYIRPPPTVTLSHTDRRTTTLPC